jgi:hypothetical protein
MTIDPAVLVIINAFFNILSAFLTPVLDVISKPYDSFVRNMLGNLLGVVAN